MMFYKIVNDDIAWKPKVHWTIGTVIYSVHTTENGFNIFIDNLGYLAIRLIREEYGVIPWQID